MAFGNAYEFGNPIVWITMHDLESNRTKTKGSWSLLELQRHWHLIFWMGFESKWSDGSWMWATLFLFKKPGITLQMHWHLAMLMSLENPIAWTMKHDLE